MTFLGGYIKLSVLKIVMKKTYASEFFFYQEPISERCEFSLQVHSKILVKQPMHESGLKTSFAEEAVWLRSDRMNFCLTLPRSLAVKLLNYLLNCNYQLSTLHV